MSKMRRINFKMLFNFRYLSEQTISDISILLSFAGKADINQYRDFLYGIVHREKLEIGIKFFDKYIEIVDKNRQLLYDAQCCLALTFFLK